MLNSIGLANPGRDRFLAEALPRPRAPATPPGRRPRRRRAIVGMGGVAAGRDALDLIAAGATHVALGTVLFADPEAPARIRRELAAEAAVRGFADPTDARGIAHAAPRSLDERSRVEGEKALELTRNLPLDPQDSGVSIPRRGDEDARAGAGSIARPAHGRP